MRGSRDHWDRRRLRSAGRLSDRIGPGPIGGTFADVLPTRLRATLTGIGCGTSAAIFGGTAPHLNTWLPPGVVRRMPETRGQPLS